MFKNLLPSKPAPTYVTQTQVTTLREEIDLQRREIETLAQEISQLREQVAARETTHASQVEQVYRQGWQDALSPDDVKTGSEGLSKAIAKKPAVKRTRKKVADE